jgi:hypothetical protein
VENLQPAEKFRLGVPVFQLEAESAREPALPERQPGPSQVILIYSSYPRFFRLARGLVAATRLYVEGH